MPNLGTFVAGAYSSAYNSVACGITRLGYEIEITLKQETLNETDKYGLSTIDAVLRGGDCTLMAEFREYRAGSISAMTRPFTGTLGGLLTAASPIGRWATDVAVPLVLTSTPATTAVASPATLTASYALLAEGYPTKILMDSRLRNVPIKFQLYPWEYPSGTVSWFLTT